MGRIRGGGGGGGCCNIYEERVHISDHKVHVDASQQPAAPGTQLPVLYDLPGRQKALPAPRPSSSAICCCFCAAVGRCDAASFSAALAACIALPPSTWPLAIGRASTHACQKRLLLRCRALRSRASPEELKARKKLKNLEFCYCAHNAKFEKAIPVPTRAPTHS